jgi:hypothetical protein
VPAAAAQVECQRRGAVGAGATADLGTAATLERPVLELRRALAGATRPG